MIIGLLTGLGQCTIPEAKKLKHDTVFPIDCGRSFEMGKEPLKISLNNTKRTEKAQ